MTSFRRMAAATALTLALPGLALAQPWSDPPARKTVQVAAAPALPAPSAAPASPAKSAEAAPVPSPAARAPAVPAAATVTVPPRPKAVAAAAPRAMSAARAPAARAESARPRREARPLLRTARYAGGAGGVWQAGDGHAFSGSFGGCRFAGFAGPEGVRLVRGC